MHRAFDRLRWIHFFLIVLLLSACGAPLAARSVGGPSVPASGTSGCSTPIAAKAWYMHPALLDYEDRIHRLAINFDTYNPFQSTGTDGMGAFFSVPGGTYDFSPTVQQTAPGVFALSFTGTGFFVGSSSKRPATIELRGTANENTGAADLTLTADGSSFHLLVAGADITGAIALSTRIATDIQAKNWPDVYANESPLLRQGGYSEALLAHDLSGMYGRVTTACRFGPAYYLRSGDPLLSDDVTDVLAVTVHDGDGPSVRTFATIHLVPESGSWSFVGGNAPGTSPGATGPKDFGIPAPPP